MKILRVSCAAAFLCSAALAQTVDVGTGAPNETVRQSFFNAYFRNNFQNLVSLPPLGNVKTFGPTGLVQEFADAAKNQNNKAALVRANASAGIAAGVNDVLQVLPGMYAYYSQVTPNTAGYPTTDTLTCPSFASAPCQYQLFDKNYALFAYRNPVAAGQNFAVRDPYYTKWNAAGGITVMGPATSPETMVTSQPGTKATLQTFDQGAVFNITSGPLTGRLIVVRQPVYSLYTFYNSQDSFLGVPTADELVLPSGRKRQTFEGGSIEYDPGSSAVLRLSVASISVNVATPPIRLNLNDTVTLQATLNASNGSGLTDRAIIWTTSNSRVVTIQPNGSSVTLKAVGGGTANIIATSEGISSPPIPVSVVAPCCQIGEGSPTSAIQQAFQDAAARNRLALKLPNPSPVIRLGAGFVQYVQNADPNTPVTYLIAVPERLAAGYVVTGAILARYLDLGGPAGILGYPISDSTPGGRQLFENGALAGSPLFVVSAPFLQKWAAFGYETGIAKSPSGEVSSVLTFLGTNGRTQTFQGGVFFTATTGQQAAKVYFAGGLILDRYISSGGAGGQFGLPVSDEYTSSGNRRQDFEGGYIEYSPGDTAARPVETPRRPVITATPNTVVAGSRLRLTAGGFDSGATLRVSITGTGVSSPDFIVNTDTGAYSWDVYVPASARSGVVSIHAVDINAPGAVADGSYTIKATSGLRLQAVKLQGDTQSGAPGALLAQPLRVAIRDDMGNPVPGIPLRFAASPGSQISNPSAVTDQNGEGLAYLRLPLAEGIALADVEVAGLVVTFSARATRAALVSFPKLSQVSDTLLGSGADTLTAKGNLLTSAAGILRYYQNRADLPVPNGYADPASLNQFLKTFCVFDSQGTQVCDGFVSPPDSAEQIVNLWRLAAFVGNNLDVSVEKPELSTIRDLVSQGFPVLVALTLQSGSVTIGSHYVDAIGIGGDGSIQIADPNPTFGRSTLNEYLSGFTAASSKIQGTISGAVRLLPRAPSSTGFLVTANVPIELASSLGPCGRTLEVPSIAATLGAAPVSGLFRLRFCDGPQAVYQLDFNGEAYRGTFYDLGAAGNNSGSRSDLAGAGPTSYKVARAAAQWVVSAQTATFQSSGVVNAASFTPDVAPGGLITIFGSGLTGAGGDTTIDINGIPTAVLGATPFQVNAQIPLEIPPGMAVLRVNSPYGKASQPVNVARVAPEIFQLGTGSAAIVNRDGTLNSPTNPARRGETVVIYGTGLGMVEAQGSFMGVTTPATVRLGNSELPVAFAGLTPGFPGLYQINLALPLSTPPGLGIPIAVKQGQVASKPAEIAIQ